MIRPLFSFPLTVLYLLVGSFFGPCKGVGTDHHPPKASYEELARQLLIRVKEGKSYEDVQERLQKASKDALEADLDKDPDRLAFWLNVYNAHIQILLNKKPELYEDRDAFFGEERVTIAGEELSFDKIEHGIIRRSKIKVSMGHMQKPFPGSFEKRFRLDELDPRIHFALNCGAKSCPPVAVYHAERIDQELDYMARTFLKETTELEKGKAHVTALFSWFRGDFGGKDGIRDMLRDHGILSEDAEPELVFKDYDWTLALGNYRDWSETSLGAYR
jgi:hypothetical protein